MNYTSNKSKALFMHYLSVTDIEHIYSLAVQLGINTWDNGPINVEDMYYKILTVFESLSTKTQRYILYKLKQMYTYNTLDKPETLSDDLIKAWKLLEILKEEAHESEN